MKKIEELENKINVLEKTIHKLTTALSEAISERLDAIEKILLNKVMKKIYGDKKDSLRDTQGRFKNGFKRSRKGSTSKR